MNELPEEIELLNPENLKVVEDCIDLGKADDDDVATIHVDRLQALLDGYKSSLAANRQLTKDLDAVAWHIGQMKRLVERAEKAEAANREQKAEIERLKQHLTAVQHIAVKLQEQRDEHESRASVGDKWIEIKEGSVPKVGDELIGITPEGEVFDLIIVEYSMARNWIYSDYIADYFTHYRKLAPPTLPAEEK